MTNLISTGLATRLVAAAAAQGLKVTTAESCTGGLIGGTLTSVAGASSVYDGGFVTYANEAKRDMLGVPWEMLMDVGAVSAPVAEAMATGALNATDARCHLAVSVTGIAGPGGGTAEKPVGLVYFGLATRFPDAALTVNHQRIVFRESGRENIRLRTVEEALKMLLGAIDQVQGKSHERG
ncbi:CinA family protein [Parvularcula sp. IMCC14364]|uniref:CinA family protein n=1 Tax=Parvularcula sp. IMCC14364 TaxID=3067902 RepID=UPI0027429418|nr:CinA family protein [Parvularcula sp. IMCC14364]